MAAGSIDDTTGVAGVGRPLPVCGGYDPQTPLNGVLERLVVEAGDGAPVLELDHQVETAFRNQ